MKKNEVFKFKEFEVSHSENAQKVSTDSVLLGAWANLKKAPKILDIGTGCGILALMAAQRNVLAKIDAIEIIPEFAREAKMNFEKSKFSSRVELIQTDIRQFKSAHYDHILVNPPYFSNSLHSTNVAKNKVRHDLNLSFDELAEACSNLLSESGKVSLVIPFDQFESVERSFRTFELYLSRQTSIKHTMDSRASLNLLEFSKMAHVSSPTEIFIKEGEFYSNDYIGLLRDFLIIF